MPRDEFRDAEFLACERSGMSAARLAERFNVTTKTVERWRRRLNVSHPVTAKYPPSVRHRLEALVEDGCPIKEAARTVGIAPRTAYRWLPDHQRWTREETGRYAVMVRELGRVA